MTIKLKDIEIQIDNANVEISEDGKKIIIKGETEQYYHYYFNSAPYPITVPITQPNPLIPYPPICEPYKITWADVPGTVSIGSVTAPNIGITGIFNTELEDLRVL